MTYIDGFLIPVPAGNKEKYMEMSRVTTPVFLEHGALRVVETWSDDVKRGKTNDFHTAVLAEKGENIVFSWIEWPSKETRDAGNEKIMADPRMQMTDEMPFSGARLIFGGFSLLHDTRAE